MRRALLFAIATLNILLPGLLTGLATSAVTARAAWAQEDPTKLIADGVLLRKGGQNEEAARLFLRAYQATKSARAVAHLGTTEYDLKRFVDAESHLAEALRTRNDPWIEERRPMIKQTLNWARSQLGWLQVSGRPAGAEVEIAGRTVGRLPLPEPVRMEGGEVYVKVSADGYETYRRSVLVQNEQTANVVVELEKIDGPVVAGRGRDAMPLGPAGPPPPLDVRGRAGGSTNWRWPAAWVSAGLAVLMTGTGVTFALIQSSKVAEFGEVRNQMMKLQCSTALTDSGGGRCPQLLSDANQAKTIAIAGFVGAGATAILATVLFATAPSASERLALGPRLTCAPDLLSGHSGATCQFRF